MAGVIGLAASLASGRNKRRAPAPQDAYAAPFFDEQPDHQQTDDDSFGDTAPITEEK